MAGQEGFEPPTHRFGVWRSTVRATALYSLSKQCQELTAQQLLTVDLRAKHPCFALAIALAESAPFPRTGPVRSLPTQTQAAETSPVSSGAFDPLPVPPPFEPAPLSFCVHEKSKQIRHKLNKKFKRLHIHTSL